MGEEALQLLVWLIVIAVWIVSAFVKKTRDARRGEEPGERSVGLSEQPEPLREDYEDEDPEDELRRFLRTITGVEQKPERPPRKPERRAAPVPLHAKAQEPAGRKAPPVKPALTEISPPGPARSGPGSVSGLDSEKMRRGVILAEILAPPRALRPFGRPRSLRLGR